LEKWKAARAQQKMTAPKVRILKDVVQLEFGSNSRAVVHEDGRVSGVYDFVQRDGFVKCLSQKEACESAWRCIVNGGNWRHAALGAVCRRFLETFKAPKGSDFECASAVVRAIDDAFATDALIALDLASSAVECIAAGTNCLVSFDCAAASARRMSVYTAHKGRVTVAPEIATVRA